MLYSVLKTVNVDFIIFCLLSNNKIKPLTGQSFPTKLTLLYQVLQCIKKIKSSEITEF
jgi:hypothetical protein